MKHRMFTYSLLLLTMLTLWTQAARAQVYNPQTGDPPPGSHIQFTFNEWKIAPTSDGNGISGTCRIDCYSDEYDEVFLRLKGLQSEGKYSVWMVNQEKGDGGERAGVGRHWNGSDAELFYFVPEKDGRGFYRGWLSRCPLGRWKYLEVRHHPKGNWKDIEGSVVVFRVRIMSE